MLENMNSRAVGAAMIGFKLVFSVCIGAVFGMLGGLLGVALFKKKDLPPPRDGRDPAPADVGRGSPRTPHTFSRAVRRRAPFAWLARCRSLASALTLTSV